MLVRYIQDDETIDHTPSADVAAGDVVVLGDFIAVAKLDIKAGRLGALAVEGTFDFPKDTASGSSLSGGTKVYWDAANQVVTATASTNVYAGKTTRDAAEADETARVRLQQ